MANDRDARVRERAYHLWIDQGRPHGHEQDHWAEATRLVEEEDQAGVEMIQDHQNDATAKPEVGSVMEDHRPSQAPANQSDEPVPVHAEKPAAKADRKAKAKAGSDASRAEVAGAPRSRKTKVKSGSMESI